MGLNCYFVGWLVMLAVGACMYMVYGAAVGISRIVGLYSDWICGMVRLCCC